MTTLAISVEERTLPLVTYVLMLLGIVTGATAVLALIIATVSQKEAPELVKSHYEFVIQTFWVGLLGFSIVLALAWSWYFLPFTWLPGLGRLFFLIVSLWVAVRSIVGILRLRAGRPISNPHTFGIPARV